MSLTRQFVNEFRPLFRMLEEPIGRAYPTFGTPHRNSPFAIFNDPFFNSRTSSLHPAIDLSEEDKHYIVEAELPGVKKENVDIRIGDNGQSVTIEGKTLTRSTLPPQDAPKGIERGASGEAAVTAATGESSNNEVAQSTPTQLSNERTFTGTSQFSRTIWLPRRVDGSNVSAKLLDGILTVRIPKADDLESVKVNIE